MNVNYNFPTELISGLGCVGASFDRVAALGKRALIMCGKSGAQKSGALADVCFSLDRCSVAYTVFDGIGANPTVDMCAAARSAADGADFIVAIGGGSVIDAGKATAVLCASPDKEAAALYDTTLPALPVVAVGITAGTGSEANCSSVITTPDGKKRGFSNVNAFPRYSFCDPAYTCTLSRTQTASTALDAFCHSVESLFSNAAGIFSNAYAEQAIQLIFPELRRLANGTFDPDNFESRERLLYGSVLAGRAICFAGTAYPHPAGYGFTEQCGLPHGAACALFATDFLHRTAASLPGAYSRLIAACGGEDELYRVLQILSENNFTINNAMADDVAQRIMASGNFARSLCSHTEETARSIVAPFVRGGQAERLLGEWLFAAPQK